MPRQTDTDKRHERLVILAMVVMAAPLLVVILIALVGEMPFRGDRPYGWLALAGLVVLGGWDWIAPRLKAGLARIGVPRPWLDDGWRNSLAFAVLLSALLTTGGTFLARPDGPALLTGAVLFFALVATFMLVWEGIPRAWRYWCERR